MKFCSSLTLLLTLLFSTTTNVVADDVNTNVVCEPICNTGQRVTNTDTITIPGVITLGCVQLEARAAAGDPCRCRAPTPAPTLAPTPVPKTPAPTLAPTPVPKTPAPTLAPTPVPKTPAPTLAPTPAPAGNPVCEICLPGQRVTKEDLVMIGEQSFGCKNLEQRGLRGEFDGRSCEFVQNIIRSGLDPCDCRATAAPTKAPTPAPTTPGQTPAPTTKAPTAAPTTKAPTKAPTRSPTKAPKQSKGDDDDDDGGSKSKKKSSKRMSGAGAGGASSRDQREYEFGGRRLVLRGAATDGTVGGDTAPMME